jgi:hypothetical protein
MFLPTSLASGPVDMVLRPFWQPASDEKRKTKPLEKGWPKKPIQRPRLGGLSQVTVFIQVE